MISLCLFLLLQQTPAPAPAGAEDPLPQLTLLTKVRRIYVDALNGGDGAIQLRDMLIASLQRTRLFVLTENPDRADAFLKGSGGDEVFEDVFSSSEGINVHAQTSIADGSNNSRYSDRKYAQVGVGENDSRHITERKHEAVASVRLVTKNGDVIWSMTEESMGAKFLGASADVADKITRRLVLDYNQAKKTAK